MVEIWMMRARLRAVLFAGVATLAPIPTAFAQDTMPAGLPKGVVTTSPLSAAPTSATPPAALSSPVAPVPLAPTAFTSAAVIPPAVAAAPMPGAVAPPATSEAAVTPAKPRKPKPPAPPPLETALSDDPTPTVQPQTFFDTAKASEGYGAIADGGGWPVVPGGLKPGSKGPGVLALRQRLAAENDVDSLSANYEVWNGELTEAVKHFQMRYGLRQTGIPAGATLKAMNVPASVRFRQLASSAQRIAGNTFPFGERYVVVNIPSTQVEAVENGRVVHHYIAIAGDVEHRSPEVEARIGAVNLNPTWTLPTSIIKNEIIPKMRTDPGYLARAKIRILDNKGQEVEPRAVNWSTERAVNYTLRQDSGAGNSLGSIRISMPNKDAVYMHDTPSKRLFGADYRFLSHGCVRVEGVYDLASWLLEGAPGSPTGVWDKPAILRQIATGAREDVKLVKPVPVIWVYMTGWASDDGTVHFRDDIYDIDTIGQVQADAGSAPRPSPSR